MRKNRVKPEGPLVSYHIVTRVVQQKHLLDDKFKSEVVEPWLQKYLSVYYIDLPSNVVMTNHTHFLIKVHKPDMNLSDLEMRFNLLQSYNCRPRVWAPEKAQRFYDRITDLSQFMKDFNWRIAICYNKLHELKGHFWDERFKSRVLEGPIQEFYTDIYIQSNPAKAGIVQSPSEYRWCTAGRLNIGFALASQVEAPALGPFARILDSAQRSKAYISCHDYFASLIYHPERKTVLPPPEVIALSLTKEDWTAACEEIRNRGPVDWSKPGYGSEAFEKKLKNVPKGQAAVTNT